MPFNRIPFGSDHEDDRRQGDFYENTSKLAGLQDLGFSYIRPLLGPVWFVYGGDIKQPP